MHRVVITGLGAVTPIGLTAEESWENCKNGVSGVGPITLFDTADYLVKIACEVKDFDPLPYMSKAEARRTDLFEQFGMAAAKQALDQSGLEITEENAGRVGVVVSSSVGGLASMEVSLRTILDKGPRRVSPFSIPMIMSNGASGLIAIATGARGPALSVASACASGVDGIGAAWRLIRSGEVDACLAGGTDHSICEVGIASFDRVGALSRDNGDYSMTPAPFDKNRSGLVVGDGAGVLMLESLEHATARGAEILAEVVGYGSTTDSFHITAPREDGTGAAAAMARALEVAGLAPGDVDYINAHGTATSLNDAAETAAIKLALGEQAYNAAISSTKSMTGHMMGATGAAEAVFCAKAIGENVAPPTIHYQTPDPVCDLDIVANQARGMPIDVAMNNAFGFGGHNAVLVFRRFTS